MTVRDIDTQEQTIEKYNWSGNQIMTPSNFTLSQTEKALSSLNVQILEIWLKGWGGFVDSTKRYCRQFIESSPINIFLMFSVFVNTLILASDGLTPDSWADFLTNLNLAFTVVFTLEMSFKMYGLGLRRYSKDFFNVFDSLVVMISLIEVVINFT